MIPQKLKNSLEEMERRQTIYWGLALGIVLELVTLFTRFGLDLQSTRDTRLLARFTLGLRIHHGYIGLLLCLLTFIPQLSKSWRALLIMLGVALMLSDFVHHFLVLWPITGSPQFDLVYPK